MYRGEWEHDHANGKGHLLYANGNIYEGGWLDDRVGSSTIERFHAAVSHVPLLPNRGTAMVSSLAPKTSTDTRESGLTAASMAKVP